MEHLASGLIPHGPIVYAGLPLLLGLALLVIGGIRRDKAMIAVATIGLLLTAVTAALIFKRHGL